MPIDKRGVLSSLDYWLFRIERAVTFLTFAGTTLLVLAGIAFRLANIAVPWTNELAQYCVLWLAFAGANLGIHDQEHVALTLLADRLSPTGRWALAVVAQVCFLIFCLYLVVTGFRLLAFQRAMGGSSFSLPVDVPTYVIYSILPLGFLCGTVHLLRQIGEAWRKRSWKADSVCGKDERVAGRAA